MLSLLFVVDIVVDKCGRWPRLEVRGSEEVEGCRLVAAGSRIGRLVLLSAGLVMVSSATVGCVCPSPRLATRLRSERVILDLERLCWLPLLLLGGESVVDWMEAYEGCLCRCGLGERRDVMRKEGAWRCGMWRCHQKRGGHRVVIGWRDGSHLLAICPSCSLGRSLIQSRREHVPCALLPGCWAVETHLSSCEAIVGLDQCEVSGMAVFIKQMDST